MMRREMRWVTRIAIIFLIQLTFFAGWAQSEDEPTRVMDLNLQAHGNFSELLYGKNSSLACNLPLSTFTFEGSGFDRIGSTYFFIDMEVGNINDLSNKMLGGAYIEFSREWCFWGNSKAAGLSIHTEFDAGVGYGGDSWGSSANGFEFKTALLGGLAYTWQGDNWFVELQLLNRYELKDYFGCGGEGWQFTAAFSYEPVKWFTLSGYADFGQNPIDERGIRSLSDAKSFHLAIEPYVWFNVTPFLSVGSRLRFTYNNYQSELADGSWGYDQKVYFAPTVGLKWRMN